MLHTAAALDPQRVQMAVCCLRHERDELSISTGPRTAMGRTIARYAFRSLRPARACPVE